jgi:hypothetical protein
MYTVLDMVRIFFPAGSDLYRLTATASVSSACIQRLFYSKPPLGYALVAYPYTGHVMAVECLGKMLVSPFSQPFFLGSPQHINVMATLPEPHYEAPMVLDLSVVRPWHTAPGPRVELTAWCTMGGVFRKLVRGDARSGAGFTAMHAAYTRLAAILPHAPPDLHLPSSVRLLFGLHCVLVELVPVVVGRAAKEEEELRRDGSPQLLSVARSIAWLAVQRVIYTDLRAPNVMVDGDGDAWLVDFDDCVLVEEAVRTVKAYKLAMNTSPGAGEADTFASNLGAGLESAFETALEQAFNELATVTTV